MSQQDVHDFLKKYKSKWYKAEHIAQRMSVSLGSIQRSVKKMRERKEIYFKVGTHKNDERRYLLYKYKK